MLTKLLSALAQAKGAAIATLIVAGAATTTVVATNTDVQTAIQNITGGGTPSPSVAAAARGNDCADQDAGGQPVVVAQRNAAEKLLRDAAQKDQKALEDLRGGGKDVDAKAVGDIVKKYDDQVRTTLDAALVQVASLTLGRDGQVRKAEASGSAKPAGSPGASQSPRPSSSERAEGSRSPKPSCSPKPSATAKATGSAAAASPKPSDQGRVAVADRTTLDADVQQIVTTAIAAMDKAVKDATDEVAKVPPADHGKPSGSPGANKPDNGGGKPSDNPGGKPTGSPGRP